MRLLSPIILILFGTVYRLGEKILDIPVAEIESVVELNGLGNDIWRESVAFIGVHMPTLSTAGR